MSDLKQKNVAGKTLAKPNWMRSSLSSTVFALLVMIILQCIVWIMVSDSFGAALPKIGMSWLNILRNNAYAGVIALGWTPGSAPAQNLVLGFALAVACCVAWALEAVICAVGPNDPAITNEQALLIRNICSAVFYAVAGVTLIRGWGFTWQVCLSDAMVPILVAALFGVLSYLCYYIAIVRLGAAKAMALNITYSAWAILFTAVLMHTMPDVKSILCSVVIVLGSLTASCDIRALFRKAK